MRARNLQELYHRESNYVQTHRARWEGYLRKFRAILAALAVVSLLGQYGFHLSFIQKELTALLEVVILYSFFVQGLLTVLISYNPFHYMKSHKTESSFLLFVSLYLLLPGIVADSVKLINPNLTTQAITETYLVITQALLVMAITPGAVRYSRGLMNRSIQPSQLLFLSFAMLILMGTALLMLPRATVLGNLSPIDALFTATSAVCVTGLIVVDTATFFTPIGQMILVILIQIGGLGIMTLTTFLSFVMGGSSRLKEYSTLQELLKEDSLGKIRRVVLEICIMTFVFEFAGALILFYALGKGESFFFSLFHSISAFCNAGFTLTTANLADPNLRIATFVLFTVMGLVIVGGLGFPALSNLAKWFTAGRGRRVLNKLSLHTKIVLWMTLLLVVGGTIGIFLMERTSALNEAPVSSKWMTALFHSVSARTAGFNTIEVSTFSIPTLWLLILLMWIGASPGSTGGGIKTTTFALSLLNVFSIAKGRNSVELFRKKVSDISVIRAFSTVVLSFFYISGALFILLLTEKIALDKLLFELISALSTVGLTTGITSELSTAGKLVIIVSMFVGRVGLLAAIMALTKRRAEGQYEYTAENVLVA